MLRLFPLLAFAFLPAVVAAPVPPSGRVAFGTNGLLTRADLEKVRFDSQPVKHRDGEKVAEPKPAKEDEIEEAKTAEPAKLRPKNRYDLAVHMPWTKFHEGEVVPAYFVLRNNQNAELGLKARLDLCAPTPTLRGECSYDVRDRATGRSVITLRSASTHCSDSSLVDVPADGFYCVSGDLNRLAGHVLPPGEYEVDWSYGALCSAPVKFSVLKLDGAKPAVLPKRLALHFLHIAPEFGTEDRPKEPGKAILWRECALNVQPTDQLSAALAVGPYGVYALDLHTVPQSDKLVEAWVEWKPYRDGDRVVVTLRAVAPHTQVRFEDVPRLYLQLETPANEPPDRLLEEAVKKGKDQARGAAVLVTPLTIEACLPRDWREWCGASGTARVAVLVTAKPVELPHGGLRKQTQEVVDVLRTAHREQLPVWAGIVRTDFTELRFPPPRER